MPTYDWIDIESPDSYDRLTEILSAEFNPNDIAAKLKSQVTHAAKGILVEHGYVDKDYRSTFYNFYSKKGRKYRSDCVRLHFFDVSVEYDDSSLDFTSSDNSLRDHYFGYVVLRPTIVATLGRSLLSPDIRRGARGSAIQTIHHVNILGHQLSVRGFPSMSQHIDIAVCAHVSCWAILRYYSEVFPEHREYLIHDITKLVAPFDQGGLVPSLGFNVYGAERVFLAAGCFPLVVNASAISPPNSFLAQFMAYLESGFPLFVAMSQPRPHAVAVIGYNWKRSMEQETPDFSHVWGQVDSLLAVDDNLLPYSNVPMHSQEETRGSSPGYSVDDFDWFIVALPDKVFYPADAVELQSRIIRDLLITVRDPNAEPLELCRYFITTISKIREHAKNNRTNLGDNLYKQLMQLDTAKYVWIVEYCSRDQWLNGHVAARAILDASASQSDEVPIWMLHDEEIVYLFDRNSAEINVDGQRLERTGFAPFQRIELNLRPVLRT